MADMPPRQQVNGTDPVRMNAGDGLPHYNDPNASSSNVDSGFNASPAAGYVTLRSQEATGDAMAILKAFQEYMEVEKQRAQRRTMIVACSLGAILAIVIIGFFVMWFSTVRSMQGTQTALITATLQQQQQKPEPAADIGAAIAAALEKFQTGQAAATKAIADQNAANMALAEQKAANKALEEKNAAVIREKEAALKAAEEANAKQAAELANALEKMNAALDAVRKDNESLKAAMKASAAAKPAPAPQLKPIAPVAVKPAAAVPLAAQKPASNQPAPKPTPAPAAQQPKPATPPPAPAAQQPKPATPPPALEEASTPTTVTTSAPITAQPEAAPAQEPTQVAEVRTVAPEIKVKRPEPPKGFKADVLPVPLGKDGARQVNWNVLIPTELH